MEKFLNGNEWQWRLARTVAQGVIGVLVANVDLIVGWCVLDPSVRGLVRKAEDEVALVVCVVLRLGELEHPVLIKHLSFSLLWLPSWEPPLRFLGWF